MPAWLTFIRVVEWIVFVALLGLSVWSIAIVLNRIKFWRNHWYPESVKIWQSLIQSGSYQAIQDRARSGSDALSKMFRSLLQPGVYTANGETDAAKMDRLFQSYWAQEKIEYDRGLPVLASLGANAPFIGLFGTVLGIVRAFGVMGEKQGAASVVMSSISVALVATAAGLLVAIPAVFAYNYFSNLSQKAYHQSESLKDLMIAHGNTK